MYKHFHDLGLVVIFPARRNGYSFVANDDFYGPFPTQERAQLEAEALAVAVRQLAREDRIIALEAQVKDLTDVLTETLAR